MKPAISSALARVEKYARARDGDGLISLLHQKRAVWIEGKDADVRVIDVNERAGTAEIRLESVSYKYLYPSGAISKEESRKEYGVEAVVPLAWLKKP